MYDKFFDFKTKPFELVPNPDFLFLSKSHKKAIAYLDYGIKERIGFILLSGEVGSGKTTIIRNIIKNLNGNIHLSKVFNTKVSSQQLIAMINEDFGLEVAHKDKVTLLRDLNDFLIDKYAHQQHTMLIIDEAQNLSPELLEEVRMLSNLETDKTKLLQIILVGQPELREALSQPELRQLRQRISISCHITPLSREETEEYIYHRLSVAGNKDAVTFVEGTVDLIHNFSKGVPRLINIACDFLLLACFVEETQEISLEMAHEVINELEIENMAMITEYPGSNGADLQAIFQGFISRLNSLEKELFAHKKNTAKKINITEKLLRLEKHLENSIRETKGEVDRLGERLKHISMELNGLKIQADQFEKMSREVPSKKREGLRRIFG